MLCECSHFPSSSDVNRGMLRQALCRHFCSYLVNVESSDVVLSNNETNSSESIGVGCVRCELLREGCARCPVGGNYCTVGVQTVQCMGVTAQWLCRLSGLWELQHTVKSVGITR